MVADEKLKLFSEVTGRPCNQSDLHNIQWLKMEMAFDGVHFEGPDKDLYGVPRKPDSVAPDIVALHPRHKEDLVTSWVCETFLPRLVRFWRRMSHPRRRVILQNDKTGRMATRLVVALLASLIQVISVVAVAHVATLGQRLATMSVSSIAFSLFVWVTTNCTRQEFFSINSA